MTMALPTVSAAQPLDLAAVREMLSEYAAWLGSVSASAATGFKPVPAEFAREVQDLPGEYEPPAGALLIARIEGNPAGMVGLRRVDNDRCEMKRLYVRPGARGAGVGRLLAERVIAEARARGYSEMLLDSLPVMQGAQRLYVALGFRDIQPYYESPPPRMRFMGLRL
ncbi:MAG: GNAT family N-acetyltransferase [Vicinamibacterales bacterium]